MARVIILAYDEFTDKKTKVKFSPTKVTRNGHVLVLGVASMTDEFAREHYEGRAAFEVQYDETPEPVEPVKAPEALTPPVDATPVKLDEPVAETEVEQVEPVEQVVPEGAEVAPVTALDEGATWYTVTELAALTIEKLKAVAKAENIDVSKCSLKDEYINTILAAGNEE